MSLLAEDRKHDTVAPSAVLKNEEKAMSIDVVRTTSHTHEQFHISCPVYVSDSREELDNRLELCYSVVQARLKKENEAMIQIEASDQKARLSKEVKKRNQEAYDKKCQAIKKRVRKGKIDAIEAKALIEDETVKLEAAAKMIDVADSPEDMKAIMEQFKKDHVDVQEDEPKEAKAE